MELMLERVQLEPDVTIGSLAVDGEFSCWVLEDQVREVPGQPVEAWKVPGKTAIPYGKYRIDITHSNRFNRLLPLLLAVPGFEGIRIHPGNTADNTEGCLLPGLDRYAKSVGRSRMAFNELYAKLRAAKTMREPMTITIFKGAEP